MTWRSLLSMNVLKLYAVVTFTELWNMVRIDDHYQVSSTSIFFIVARLLQGQSTIKGSLMKNIWEIFPLTMSIIAHLMSLLQLL